MRSLPARVAALPRVWVGVLLLVAALDLAVVVAATGRGGPGAGAARIAPLVAGLGAGTPLVSDGMLVAGPGTWSDGTHVLVVDPAAHAATVTAPEVANGAARTALVLTSDGLVVLDDDRRWTRPYSGSLTSTGLHALLAGWQDATRGPVLLLAVLTGVLATALSSAVLLLAVRLAARPVRVAVPPRHVLAWWAASLALASTLAAVVVPTSGTDSLAIALGATLAVATLGVCGLASDAVTFRSSPARPAPAGSP